MTYENDTAALRAAVPAGGRRSKPSPRFFAVGGTRFRRATRDGAGLKTGVPYRPGFPADRMRRETAPSSPVVW